MKLEIVAFFILTLSHIFEYRLKSFLEYFTILLLFHWFCSPAMMCLVLVAVTKWQNLLPTEKKTDTHILKHIALLSDGHCQGYGKAIKYAAIFFWAALFQMSR